MPFERNCACGKTVWADRKRLRYLITFGAVGAALTAFWMLPFLLQRHYLTDMGYEKRTDYWKMMFPHGTGTEVALLVLVVVGLAVSVAKGRRLVSGLGYFFSGEVSPLPGVGTSPTCPSR